MTIQSAASALDRYVAHRIPPGDFLTSVLENKLAESIFRADKESLENLEDIVRHCWSNLPASVWGSPEAVQRHLKEPATNSPANDIAGMDNAETSKLAENAQTSRI